jgi:molybdate/tungstate transport system substrate-binding protein
VITQPGFLIGRTDPATDPKGTLTDTAIADAAKMYNLPDLTKITSSNSNVYPEETRVGRLQAGQLDARFFYNRETTAAGIPTVPPTGLALKATYTATVLNEAPTRPAAKPSSPICLVPRGNRY